MVRYVALFLNRSSSEDHLIGAAEDVLSSIQETNEHVKEARVLRPPLEAEGDYTLAESKMRRALDRLKRTATKVIDGPDDARSSGDGIVKAVKSLLMDIATTTEALLSPVGTVGDPCCFCIVDSACTFRNLHQKTTPHCLIYSSCWHGQRLLQPIPS